MKWWVLSFKNYANFSGRAQRAEYWMFQLLTFIVFIGAFFFSLFVAKHNSENIFLLLVVLIILILIVPAFSVLVRRLHDIGRSGWWMLINMVPFIGGIWLFVLTVTDSDSCRNGYGENPKNKQQI